MTEHEAAPRRHSITSEGLSGRAVKACWGVATLLMVSGITATFVAGTGAAPTSMILFGSLFLLLALMHRVPLSLEVGGAKFDASYEREAFEAGRDAGLQHGVEVALNDVEKAEESGESPQAVLERRRDAWSAVSLWIDQAGGVPSTAGGYRNSVVCSVAGITRRQLDYWDRTSLVSPTGLGAEGVRLYTADDILLLKVVKRLLDAGITLQQIRVAVDHLRGKGPAELDQLTLMSDGESIYEATSADEVIDLMQSGEGMFGIAVGRVRSEVMSALRQWDEPGGPTG